MTEYEKITEVLEQIRLTITEIQAKFSQAAELLNRRNTNKNIKISQVSELINKLNSDLNRDNCIREYDKAISSGDMIKNIISCAQEKYLNAIRTINQKQAYAYTDDQVIKIQNEINQATIDIVCYNELLRRIYDALGIPLP